MNTIDIAREALAANHVEFRLEEGRDRITGALWTAIVVPGKLRFYTDDEESHLAVNLLHENGYATATLQASGSIYAVAALAELAATQWAV